MKLVNLLFILFGLSLLGACASIGDDGPVMARSTSPFIPVGAVVDAPSGYAQMCRDRPVLCADGRMAATPDTPKPWSAPVNASAPVSGALIKVSWSSSTDSLVRAASAEPKPMLDATWRGPRPDMTAVVAGDSQPTAAPDRRLPISTRLRMLEAVDRYVNGNVHQASDLEAHGVQNYWTRSGVGPGARGNCKELAIEKRLELIDQGYPPSDLVYAIVYRPDLGLHAVLVAHTELGDLVLDSRTPEIVLWNHAPYTWIKRQSTEDPSVWNLVDTTQAVQPALRLASLEGVSSTGRTTGDGSGTR